MIEAMHPLHVLVPAHRFQSIADEIQSVNSNFTNSPIAASIGLNDRERITALYGSGVGLLFLELAHADSKAATEEIKWIRNNCKNALVVAGNVATADACNHLFNAGAHIVKVGIGSGSICTTRLITGCGVPQLSAIMECSAVGPIIADGGIRNSGDLTKALAAGASFVMIGSLFAGTDEAAGGNSSQGHVYYGMASAQAGRVKEGCVPEGISTTVPYVGSAVKVANDLLAGLRQGMAMVGAKNLKELREKAVFQRVTSATVVENQPHILFRR
jgi:IMP dehydrogenase